MARRPLSAFLVLLVAMLAGCPSGGKPDRPGPSTAPTAPPASTSDAKIQAAEDGGRLTRAEAVQYRVFAVHADPRLPATYRGDHTGLDPTMVMSTAGALFADTAAPAAIRAAIGPYLLPPPYEESWAHQKGQPGPGFEIPQPLDLSRPLCASLRTGDWSYVEGVSSPVRVWWHGGYPERAGYAAEVRDEFDRYIWDSVTKYFGRGVLPDERRCSAGSGRLDIYLLSRTDPDALGVTKTVGGHDCTAGTPGFIELSVGQRDGQNGKARLLSTAAHEFTHAVLLSLNYATAGCHAEYYWLDEATARWVEQWLYPAVDGEREPAGAINGAALFDQPDVTLEAKAGGYKRWAHTWVFLLYLSRAVGHPTVAAIWRNAERFASSVEAIDHAAPFRTAWPGFARVLWNRDPVTDLQQWDHLTGAAKAARTETVDVATNRTIVVDTAVAHRASRYFHFTFTGKGPKRVTVVNGLAGSTNAAVQVIVKRGGVWTDTQPVDPVRIFCCPPLEELVLIVSNTDSSPAGSTLPIAPETKIVISD